MTVLMKAKLSLATAAIVVAATALLGSARAQEGGLSSTPAYEGVENLETIHLTFAETSSAAQSPQTQAFVDYVEAASQGKITIEVFWSGALMPTAEVPSGVAAGLADMGTALPVYTPADFPVTNWLNALSNQFRGGQPNGKLVAGGANSEFHVLNNDIRREYEEQGIHILGASAGNAYDLLCNKHVSNLEEARGKRTRSPNQAFANEVSALGMTPVPIVIAEVYEAYSRGIIDCVILFPWGYNSFGLSEVSGDKYWVHIELSGWMANLMLINKARWDGLSPLAQRILVDGYTRYLQSDAEETFLGTRLFGDFIRSGDITPIQISEDMAQTLQDHQDAVIEAMVANAPPGVEDPQATVDQFMALMEKWRAIVENDIGIQPEPDDIEGIVDSWYEDYDFDAFQRRLAEELALAYAQREN